MAVSDRVDIANGRLSASASRPGRPGSVDERDREAERTTLKQLAQEFEAMLLNEMLADWRRSLIADPESDAPAGLGTMTDVVGAEFGRALSRGGGVGIAAVLLRSFERQQTSQATDGGISSGTAAPTTPVVRDAGGTSVVTADSRGAAGSVPAQMSVRSEALADRARQLLHTFAERTHPVTGTVTSSFGWRTDPFSGQATFHTGLDLRMAYGEPVASVAPGRVSFAGDQRGYGLTVIVDHADGLQTRYAHLSSTGVQVGDEVQPGQIIARSGNSGRSTAPHLHVELLRGGRPVDPAGLLKGVTPGADWMTYQSPSMRGHE
ncbi:MAG: peptidoglycan DD-metalloendopeptidase family protein [Vicinamibacterales bacterium]